jgi:Hyaluronidase
MRFLLLLLLSSVALAQQFPVFDATGYTDKPGLTQYGLKPITVAYPAFMWDKPNWDDKTTLPDKAKLQHYVDLAKPSGILVIDIEHWPISGSGAAQSVKQFQTVLQWAKASDPSLKVGFYGIMPQRDYWSPNQPTHPEKMTAWKQNNTGLEPLASQVDIIFPSLYTFYDDQAGWKKYAIQNIAEARRIAPGKPVYVFLWPQMHSAAGNFLPADYWTMELQTAKQYADGAVIWCCTGRPKWDDNAAWWKATLTFLKAR